MTMKISRMTRVTDRQSLLGETMAPDQILSLMAGFFRRQYPLILAVMVTVRQHRRVRWGIRIPPRWSHVHPIQSRSRG